MKVREKVRQTANFTPLQAQIFEELASEVRNNQGIILHLCLDPDRYYHEKKIVIEKVQAALAEIARG
jgi:hypothetical protein